MFTKDVPEYFLCADILEFSLAADELCLHAVRVRKKGFIGYDCRFLFLHHCVHDSGLCGNAFTIMNILPVARHSSGS